ncbi:MAG TPA: hypothetical protein VFN61_08865, partial [Acidimicrobiales bacterium]|nr:hypothetical protein [Acidimicrobiales bacterium]
DPERMVQRRWLGSLVGVYYQGRRTDLVLRTDGLFVVPNVAGAVLAERLKYLSAAERDALLSSPEGALWWPCDQVLDVTLQRPPLLKKHKRTGVLEVRGADNAVHAVEIVSEVQATSVKNTFPLLFGNLFTARI